MLDEGDDVMRMLPVVVLVGAVASASYASAQDNPVVVSKPRYTTDVMRKRISGEAPVTCRLADKTEHLVTTTVAVGGKTYRCVTVLDENFNPVGAAWTPVQQ
jgi:hypothetical protein